MPSAEVLACCRCWRGESHRSREVHYGAKIISLTGCSFSLTLQSDQVQMKSGSWSSPVQKKLGIQSNAPIKLTTSVVQNKACRECSCLICPAGFINLCLWNTNHDGNILSYRLHVYTCNVSPSVSHATWTPTRRATECEDFPKGKKLRKHIYFYFHK